MTDDESVQKLRELLREFVHERLRTFDDRVEQLERACCQTLGGNFSDYLKHDSDAKRGSRLWYAKEILFAIECARGYLSSGDAQRAASEAMVVGVLATESDSSESWPEVGKWLDLCERNRQAALKRGRNRSAAAEDLALRVRHAADAYRAKHPYDLRTRSQRRLARDLAKELGENWKTVRGHLQRLEIH